MKKAAKPKVKGKDFTEKAARLFNSHTCNVFYFTADGEAFAELAHAKGHAASLNNSEIQTLTRDK